MVRLVGVQPHIWQTLKLLLETAAPAPSTGGAPGEKSLEYSGLRSLRGIFGNGPQGLMGLIGNATFQAVNLALAGARYMGVPGAGAVQQIFNAHQVGGAAGASATRAVGRGMRWAGFRISQAGRRMAAAGRGRRGMIGAAQRFAGRSMMASGRGVMGGSIAISRLAGPVATVTASLAALAVTAKVVDGHFQDLNRQFARYNPANALAMADREVRTTFRDMERSQRTGGTVAEVQFARNRLEDEMMRAVNGIHDFLIGKSAPYLLTIIDALSSMLKWAEETKDAMPGAMRDGNTWLADQLLKWLPGAFGLRTEEDKRDAIANNRAIAKHLADRAEAERLLRLARMGVITRDPAFEAFVSENNPLNKPAEQSFPFDEGF